MTPATFFVYVLSGALVMFSGATVSINTTKPFGTMALCEDAAAQVRAFVSMDDTIFGGSMECRPHELPIPPMPPDPLAPMREAR